MDDRMIMFLDLDETLVHSTFFAKLNQPEDFRFGNYYVYARPYLSELIEKCNRLYSLAVWSSASQEYVHAIVNRFIPSCIELKFIWARPNYLTADVVKWGNTKSLKRLVENGFDPSRVLILDDNADDTTLEYGNVIQVKPYRGEVDDCELLLLSKYLQKMSSIQDSRDIVYSWREEVVEITNRSRKENSKVRKIHLDMLRCKGK